MEKRETGRHYAEAAKHIETARQEMRRTMAPITLRYILHMLISGKLTNEERPGYIYEALSAASDAGLVCGIRSYELLDGDVEVYAIIELPTGNIAFALAEYDGHDFMTEPQWVKDTAEAFIGDEGYGRREESS